MDTAWVWQDFSIAANELFSVSHGEVYTITPARPCKACLCHAAGEQLHFLRSGSEGERGNVCCHEENPSESVGSSVAGDL